MFFGLTNSPATFQTMMDTIFREKIAKGDVLIYMNDILIATARSLKHHCQQVNNVLKKLLTNDLYLNPKKCQFHVKEVEFSGAIVGKDGPNQSQSHWRMAHFDRLTLTSLIPQLWQLLQRLHRGLLKAYTSISWSYKERHPPGIGVTHIVPHLKH